ncbi:MAG: hypothetical protein KDA75_17820, partial [Planctomycetaceae bacterium]|nr:hypothetical protein [Planctomycetaceae bacterium]
MISVLSLPRHDGLCATTRLGRLRPCVDAATAKDWVLLGLAGVVAATLSTLLDFSLKIPGHAILRAVFPMAAGLALVPRRGAGAVMGLAAGVAVAGFHLSGLTGHGLGGGAMTSLLATGPLLDAALWRVRTGWQLWAGCAAAGLLANLLAFLVRGASKMQLGSSVTFQAWLSRAPVSYLLCGLLA